MKIYFNYEETKKEIYFDNTLIFHGNIDNQVKIYKEICDGLQGTSKDFLLDNQPVKKKEFNIIEFSNNTIFDDLKLTSKSYNLKILDSIVDTCTDEIISSVNNCIQTIESKIQNSYMDITKEYQQVKPTIEFQDVRKLLINNFSLVEKEDTNISLQIEIQLMIILDYIKIKREKKFYLLIKHFNHFLDISQMTYILECFKNIPNVIIIVFVKSFELYEVSNLNHYMLDNNHVFKMDINYSEHRFENVLTDIEIEELSRILNTKKRYQGYCKIVNEKI